MGVCLNKLNKKIEILLSKYFNLLNKKQRKCQAFKSIQSKLI